jgi:hypothetical protein
VDGINLAAEPIFELLEFSGRITDVHTLDGHGPALDHETVSDHVPQSQVETHDCDIKVC